jgi:hypothetical protein
VPFGDIVRSVWNKKRPPQLAAYPLSRFLLDQMKLPSFLSLNANDRAISRFHVGFSIQRYLDRKVPRLVTSKDLNASNGLTTGPLPDGLKALFPESPIA